MRSSLILIFAVMAGPSWASETDFCKLGAPMLRAEVLSASELLASSDLMAQPMLASNADVAIAALGETLTEPELTAFSNYAHSYEKLRPVLQDYVKQLGVAATIMEACAAKAP